MFGNFTPLTSTNNTAFSLINFPGLQPNTYTIRLVDSILYYSTLPNGSNPNSIYDQQQFTVSGVDELNTNSIHLIKL